MKKRDIAAELELAGDESSLLNRRAYLLRMAIIVSVIQFVTFIVLAIIYPTTDLSLWRILLFTFIIILILSVAAIVISWREAQQIRGKFIHDSLTHLFARDYLEETLEREIHRSFRSQSTIGIIMVEIDRFKAILASSGQSVGDLVMKQLAQYLQQSVRVSDMACRYDGDELVLVLNEASPDITLARAEHILARVKKMSLTHEEEVIDGFTSSIGIAIYPDHGETVETLLKTAEDALQQAKSNGGDQVVIYQKEG